MLETIYRKARRLIVHLVIVLLLSVTASAQTLISDEQIYTNEDALEYRGYRITRQIDEQSGDATAILQRNDSVIARFSGWPRQDGVRFGLFSLLGGDDRQLIVEEYSGGAHCCSAYMIFDIRSDGHRVIYDSRPRGNTDSSVGYSLGVVDINGDGIYELTQSVMTFDYALTSHASSPFPLVVFKYDEQRRRYEIVNRQFPDYVMREVGERTTRIRELASRVNRSGNQFSEVQFFSLVVSNTLDYIYAGRAAEGWAFFEREYILSDKAELRQRIQQVLDRCEIYRALYPNTR